jgi:aminomethyltransferase
MQLAKLFPELNNALSQLKPFQSIVCACAFGEIMFSRTGYTGEDGFELFLNHGQAAALWDALLQVGVLPAGLGARDTLRIEAGYNLYGQDMSLTTKPIDCGLSWTVDSQANRSFVGAQALRSSNQQRALLGLVLLDKGILRVHQEVITKQGNGTITSGTFSPSLQKSIAFASLPKETPLKSIVHVKVRDQLLQAQVVKNAFVRLGQPLL